MENMDTMARLEFHPACLMLPKMDAEEFTSLKASIAVGYNEQHPIILHKGQILDGRHRYLACKEVEVRPVFITRDDVNPYEYVRREHEARRSWKSQEQKALVLGELVERSDEWSVLQNKIQHEANQKRADAARGNDNAARDRLEKTVVPQSVAQLNQDDRRHKSAPAKASILGVNRGAVERAATIKRKDPELAEKVASGEVTATNALREIRRKEIIAQLEDTTAKEAKAIEGVFDVIVIDPPWPMQKIERDVRPNQSEFDYPTMDEEELASLDIPAALDCHIWLWTTHKFLPMSMRLLDAWDLKYVCAFVWHKPGGFQPIGLPQYNCEFALYARKGAPQFIDTKAFNTCFNAPRGAHSEKPEEFYEIVRRVTAGRRLDMFNRRLIKGFESWGKEAA
jgi:N6-adenosine-specific RNA methylase IME4